MYKKIADTTLPDTWNSNLLREPSFGPLRLEWEATSSRNKGLDGLLCVQSENLPPARFGVQYLRDGSPRQIANVRAQIASLAFQDNLHPLIIVPYLPEERLLELEQAGISSLDLCGNGVLMAPDAFLVFRSGYPNLFSSSRPLKNVYRGVSSLVARAFLLRPEYSEVSSLQQEIIKRGGDISLPTVSKVIKELEDDLIISRVRQKVKPQARDLTLLQSEKLLDRLAENYEPPRIRRSFVGKVVMDPPALKEALRFNAERNELRLISTGVGSARLYSSLVMENTLTVYTDSVDRLLKDLSPTPTTRFPNIDVRETSDPTVYFDRRPDENGFPNASPITSYLEMAKSEERLAQSALQLREKILIDLKARTK